MGNNSLQLNPGKIIGFGFGPSESRTMPTLQLDGIALPQADSVYSLGV